MWRLSWITFIFLPLTFIGGFFGMNVDAFQPSGSDYPSIKWYFVAAVPLMCIVVILYFVFKRADRFDGRNDPVRRGAYEHIFQDFATEFPDLWSRYGPRDHVQPRGFWSAAKWRLVTYWFDPRRTVAARSPSDIDEMGLWAKLKRRVARRWLAQLQLAEGSLLSVAEMGDAADFGTVFGLLSVTPVAMADGDPAAAVALRPLEFRRAGPMRSRAGRRRSHSTGSRHSAEGSPVRPSSGGGSSPMVDEERSSDDEPVSRTFPAAQSVKHLDAAPGSVWSSKGPAPKSRPSLPSTIY